MKLGLIVFGNHSGLGHQTRRLAYMLKPDRVLYIDATSFSKNKQNNFDWYSGFEGYKVDGFPTNHEIRVFLQGLTHVIVCENPLNFYLFAYAKTRAIKTYCQSNYEFCDNLNDASLPTPDYFLMPSYWHLDTMKAKFGDEKVKYLPPPIDTNDFKEAREENMNRKGVKRFLHIVGTLATHDRNGTLDLLSALQMTKADFELVIHSQHELPEEYIVRDSRVKYRFNNFNEAQEIYKDFDALILPRRYGGLCLPMAEALMSGLPVIMTDISPNNKILPKKWLVSAEKYDEFKARAIIDVYQSNIIELAKKIDEFVEADLSDMKVDAFALGHEHYSFSALREKYNQILNI